MKAALIFSGTGPILILSTYPSLIDERFVEKLDQKGIHKFIAFEVPEGKAQSLYGARFTSIKGDLADTEDMRVLDYNGHTAFNNFSFDELGEPVKYGK